MSAYNSLVGSTTNDNVGSLGEVSGSPITKIGTAGFVVCSPNWDNGAATDAGAVTYILNSIYFYYSGAALSATNSLVGSSANDNVGSLGGISTGSAITTIGTTGWVVSSPKWDNDATMDAGAVTYNSTTHYNIGAISASNSLVGSSANDNVGSLGGISTGSAITAIGTTGWVVSSPNWDNGTATNAGAVTYNTTTYYNIGAISASNSLVGSHPDDYAGSGGTTFNGTVITVVSPHWCYNAGATSQGSTSYGIYGVISAANSTVGAESAVPEIDLQQPLATDLPNNGSCQFGSVSVGSTVSLTFVIKNSGTDDLLLSGSPRVSITGADAAAFSVNVQPPYLVVTGDAATFSVTFTPASSGSKTAVLSIANNDSNENPYLVTLGGSAVLPISNWRQTYFGSTANSGDAADTADYDHDGIPNILEYAFGLNPVQNTSGQLPAPSRTNDNFVYTFDQPSGVTSLTYEAEWSTSLTPNSWQPVSDTGAAPHHIFSVPIGSKTQIFMRLNVTAP